MFVSMSIVVSFCLLCPTRFRKFRFRLRLNRPHSNRHKQCMYRLSQVVIKSVRCHNLFPNPPNFLWKILSGLLRSLVCFVVACKNPFFKFVNCGLSDVWSDLDNLLDERFSVFKLSRQPLPQISVLSLRVDRTVVSWDQPRQKIANCLIVNPNSNLYLLLYCKTQCCHCCKNFSSQTRLMKARYSAFSYRVKFVIVPHYHAPCSNSLIRSCGPNAWPISKDFHARFRMKIIWNKMCMCQVRKATQQWLQLNHEFIFWNPSMQHKELGSWEISHSIFDRHLFVRSAKWGIPNAYV